MIYSADLLRAAHKHTTDHRRDLERSDICGCFYCLQTFQATEIEIWLEEGSGTALCPRCGIDSVLGVASGYPAGELAFLNAMHGLWF